MSGNGGTLMMIIVMTILLQTIIITTSYSATVLTKQEKKTNEYIRARPVYPGELFVMYSLICIDSNRCKDTF